LPMQSLFKWKHVKKREGERKQKAENILETIFGAADRILQLRNEPAKELSYGQKRLLGLARLFMSNYKLVLLDEPTAGVNPKLNEKIAEIIKSMVNDNEMTVFLIEHNMGFVKQVSDICAFLHDKIIFKKDTPEIILSMKIVRNSYLGLN